MSVGGDGGGGDTGGNLSAAEAAILGLSPADVGVTPTGNAPSPAGGGYMGESTSVTGPEVNAGPQPTGVISPVSTQVETPAPAPAQSTKVTEAKAAVTRKARRRSLLGGEEGGLEPINIYRRSILGS